MDEITLDDKVYVSSKRAAKITGYAKDYVGQLCREGKVEARLVGRNWYVLETSIREHRFGPVNNGSSSDSDVKEKDSNNEDDWKPSRYTSDLSPELIPTLIPQPVPAYAATAPQAAILDQMPPVELIKPEPKPLNASIVSDMQSAWQDWFSRTGELKVSKEVLLEESYSEEPQELLLEHPKEVEDSYEIGTTPIVVERVTTAAATEIPQADEEIVPIRRTYAQPQPVQKSNSNVSARSQENHFTPLNPLTPQGRVIKERRITVTKKKPSILLQTLLIIIGLVCIAGTVVGSGILDSYASTSNLQFKVFTFLAGESSVNK